MELLIVIGVLSILLSILLPVFHSTRKAALRSRAHIEATALAQAVIEYKNVYGYWPGMIKASSANQLKLNDDALENKALNWPLVSKYCNDSFKVTVRQSDGSVKEANYVTDNTLYRSLLPFDSSHLDTGAGKNLNPLNPQRIRFIDLTDEQSPSSVSLPDPWGNQYIVVMGLNPATTFTQDFTQNGTLVQRLSVSNLTAFALSRGADSTNYIFSAGVPQ